MANYVVVETNSLSALTVDSIKTHDSDAVIKQVSLDNGFIPAGLNATNEPSLVLGSGVVFRGDWSKLPTNRMLQYPICVSEIGVFFQHERVEETYKLVKSPTTAGNIDLSVHFINPKLWRRIPDKDTGVLPNLTKKLTMPRFMNHKTDELVKDALQIQQCLYYGVLGLPAYVLNYVPCLEADKVSVTETMAYCFDHLERYSNGLDTKDKERVLEYSDKTRKRWAKFRDGLGRVNGLRNLANGT